MLAYTHTLLYNALLCLHITMHRCASTLQHMTKNCLAQTILCHTLPLHRFAQLYNTFTCRSITLLCLYITKLYFASPWQHFTSHHHTLTVHYPTLPRRDAAIHYRYVLQPCAVRRGRGLNSQARSGGILAGCCITNYATPPYCALADSAIPLIPVSHHFHQPSQWGDRLQALTIPLF
jgi:hypothetical protein